ncbi:MAG TPA: TonB-dependent receptor [Terracidiphilus sp.]|nr:TonB-dependent receptor [Terracidiphilus sp.]
MNRSLMQTFSVAGMRLASPRIKGFGVLCVAFIALFLTLAPQAGAQDNATISGTVADNTGAMLPNATIALTNIATSQTRETTANSVGAFHFGNVGAGTYTLSATATGFQKFTRTGIIVNVAQTLEENATLTIGSQAQTVTVEADALQVQTETSEVSTLISGEQVRQLATNGRNVVQLAALGLGVSNNLPAFGGIDALTSANGISFNGQRPTHNVYLLDGAEQNDRGCGGCFMNLPSQDAIGEFQTLGSNYSADYGIGSGGTIVMMLKSGSRKYHGTLYEFNRNTDYNANDYFLKAAGKPRSVFQLNEPGGNIGGPLWIPRVYNDSRNRTFFFWNEEWRRLIKGSSPSISNALYAQNFPAVGQPLNYKPQSATVTPIVPNLPLNTAFNARLAADGLTPGGSFNYNSTTGTYLIPANLIDQNIAREIPLVFPQPNYNNGTQYIISVSQPENIREDAVRIDHTINSKFQLMGHYLHDAMQNTFFPPLWTGSFATVGTTMLNPSYTVAIKLTQTYSSNLLNETGFFYSGNKISLTPIAGAGYSFAQPSGWTAQSFFPTANNLMAKMPAITLNGQPLGATWNAAYFPWRNGYEGFQYKDDLSWQKGRHQFKFGISWLHDYKNQQLQANTNGTATFDNNAFALDGIVNMVLGMQSSFQQLEFLYGKHWVNNNYSGYGIDNWHVTPRLTLNLGIRYDGLPHAFERYDKFSNFVIGDYNTTLPNPVQADGTLAPGQLSTFAATGSEQFYLNGIKEAGVGGFPRGNVQDRFFTFQPRIGFALDLFGTGKTVLRGGMGMFFERVQGNDVYNAALNPPFAYQPQATNVLFSNPNTNVNTGATSSQSFPSGLTNIKYNYPPPGTANWSLGIQHQLLPSVVMALQYVGSDGWDQNDDAAINTLPLSKNDASCPLFSLPITDPNYMSPTSPNAAYCDRFAVKAGKVQTNHYRQFPGFAGITQEENETNSIYHSLQTGVRFENKWGLTSQLAYTWSHLIDTAGNDLASVPNPFNYRYGRGSGGFDRRQVFNASFVYAIPFAKHSSNLLEKAVIGDWGISGVVVDQAGMPQAIGYNGSDTLGLGGGTSNRAMLLSKVTYPHTKAAWMSTSSFGDPVAPWNGGTGQGFGTSGKDAVVGPGLVNLNLTLTKNIQLTGHEGPNIELRFESFNTLNHTQWGGIDASNHDGNFGQVTSVYSNRILELGGKLHF